MVNTARLFEPSDLFNNGLIVCQKKPKEHSYGIFYGENPLDFTFPLVLLQMSLVILVTHLLHFLLKPFRQPKIVSEILGGIILGPSVLGRNEKYRAYMFPVNSYYMIRNIGVVGFMYFFFLAGVKMDITVITRARKKHWYIGLAGVVAPFCSSLTIAFLERKSLDKETAKASSIWGISSSLSMASFPVLYPIIRELNLLSSGIGRMALYTAIVSDVTGMNTLLIFEAWKQGEHRAIVALWYVVCFMGIVTSIVGAARQAMLWIVRNTPEGKPVDQIYVVTILAAVMVVGFIADMFGLTIVNGPLWLGLAVPDGPPLGAIVVEKSETFVRNIFMPFSFLYIGIIFDFSYVSEQWSQLKPFVLMVLAAFVARLVSTLVASRFFDMVVKDSLALSLIMSLKGEVDILLFLHLTDRTIIGREHFTIIVITVVSVTALVTPLISILYNPTRPYMVNKRRNIQHSPPNTELHIVACIDGEENLSGVLKLLEVSNPTVNSPISVYTLYMVELVGRSNPVLIDHKKENQEQVVSDNSNFSSIQHALRIFQETRGECLKISSYTTITSKKSMYQDICELALSKKACMIIVLFNKNNGVNSNVLAHAPCSVGILVDRSRSPFQNLVKNSMHRHLAVIFLGGADAREALSYADRMAVNPDISLTVIRFLSDENEGDNKMEKKLDDGLVTWFWVKSEGSNRIVYREVVVRNGEETIASIQALDKERYDLWIVGRKNGINPVLLKGLSNWSENNELGVIGDYVASADFDSRASVLAVQQQVLRGQDKGSSTSVLGGYSFCTRK
ncbi:hypothetical protein ABFX02_04G084500 [Erythranthe guttata]